MDVKMCKNVYIFSWATIIVYIYTVTVAHLSIKIILSLYDIKTSFSLYFLSPLTEHTNASLKSQLLIFFSSDAHKHIHTDKST